MNYMDRLTGNTRTHTPTIARASVTDSRTAVSAARAQDDRDYRPDRDILACMRQRHGVCG